MQAFTHSISRNPAPPPRASMLARYAVAVGLACWGCAMAGDWLPMRLNLYDDPAVIAIAAECGIADRDTVVGKLHRLWSWANQHTSDGYAARVTKTNIDALVGVTGFAQALENVVPNPWLAHDEGGIWFPNFGRWNGKPAKLRLQSAFRMQKKRYADRYADSVTKAQPEKEKEKEITIPPNPPFANAKRGNSDSAGRPRTKREARAAQKAAEEARQMAEWEASMERNREADRLLAEQKARAKP